MILGPDFVARKVPLYQRFREHACSPSDPGVGGRGGTPGYNGTLGYCVVHQMYTFYFLLVLFFYPGAAGQPDLLIAQSRQPQPHPQPQPAIDPPFADPVPKGPPPELASQVRFHPLTTGPRDILGQYPKKKSENFQKAYM